MTEEMITRGELKGLEMSVPWMVTSGVRIESGHPARQIVQDGIQLYVVGADRTALRLDLDVHDAGDLHQALEAHMENVAAHDVQPMTLEERRRALRGGKWEEIRGRNLKAIQDEIDNPLRTRPGADPEFLAAMENVLDAWAELVDGTAKDPEWIRYRIREDHPRLAAALDRLAALNA